MELKRSGSQPFGKGQGTVDWLEHVTDAPYLAS